jgi:hypothetical protein
MGLDILGTGYAVAVGVIVQTLIIISHVHMLPRNFVDLNLRNNKCPGTMKPFEK